MFRNEYLIKFDDKITAVDTYIREQWKVTWYKQLCFAQPLANQNYHHQRVLNYYKHSATKRANPYAGEALTSIFFVAGTV